MKRRKYFLDPMKEESWLNAVLKEGYSLKSKTWLNNYYFEPSTEKKIIRVDYQSIASTSKYREYKQIHNDMGWDLIDGSRMNGVHIWQKKKDDIEELNELNTDHFSKIEYYKRMMSYSSIMAVFFIFLFFLLTKGGFHIFLTPGLWGMKGEMFWKAFLFELPFALMRLFSVLFMIWMAATYITAYSKYNKLKKRIEKG